MPKTWFADEIADCVTACVNLAARYHIDLQAALDRVEKRNRERGRYA
jgi:NTP pyrophosphatase (non-canonical NTP hydrolase)